MSVNPKKSEIRNYIQKLTELFPDTNFDLALKIWQKYNPDASGEETEASSRSGFSSLFPSILKDNVKNLIGSQSSDSVISELITRFYEYQGEHKEYRSDQYIDTLTSKQLEFKKAQQYIFDTKKPCNAVVYVLGGGSYFEYQKVMETQEKIGKQIIYG